MSGASGQVEEGWFRGGVGELVDGGGQAGLQLGVVDAIELAVLDVGGQFGGEGRDILGQSLGDFGQGREFSSEFAGLGVVDGVGGASDQRRRGEHVADLEHQLDSCVFGLDVVGRLTGGQLVTVEQAGGRKVGEGVDAQ